MKLYQATSRLVTVITRVQLLEGVTDNNDNKQTCMKTETNTLF